ncbi:MAG: FecR domain-containing protein [Deltaproteobacteria bacterium]|nr:FecR domain-containing protein [Deltaproteobacteria bacterium]
MQRRTVIALAAVAGVAVVAVATWIAVRSLHPESRLAAPADDVAPSAADTAAPTASADTAPVEPTHARVESVEGPVTVRRTGTEAAVAVGAELEADDILTTGPEGRAVVRVDEENTVVLEPGTSVTWGAITGSLSSVQLERGFLSAQTGRPGGRLFRVQALERTAQVEASAGAFDVAGDDRELAVAAADGEVAVRSAGETVVVEAGRYTTVRRGERPGTPRQLPGNVVAEMFWPGDLAADAGNDRLVAERAVVVRGRLSDGLSGVLAIRNERTGETYHVVTRPDGSFETQVALAEDIENPLVVAGRTVGGVAVGEQRAVVLQDSTPPPLNVRIQ